MYNKRWKLRECVGRRVGGEVVVVVVVKLNTHYIIKIKGCCIGRGEGVKRDSKERLTLTLHNTHTHTHARISFPDIERKWTYTQEKEEEEEEE